MERAQISAIAHAEHPVMAPLSDGAVDRLLAALPIPDGGSVADFGCGQGVWLVRLLQQRPDLMGVGIDVSREALAAAGQAATAAGIDTRVRWVAGEVTAPLDAPVDAALCVGSTHAFGGLRETLAALRERLRPGGSVLLGEGFWEQPPSARATAIIGDLPDLAGLTAACHDHGFAIVDGHISTAGEWDDYEWSWVGSLTRWGLDHRDTADGATALAVAREHLDEWVAGYRGQLGFATLLLQR